MRTIAPRSVPVTLPRAPEDASARLAPPEGQLPDFVEPLHYEVSWVIDPRRDVFSGDVRIAVRVHRRTSRIFLHAEDLRLSWAEYRPKRGDARQLTWSMPSPDGVMTLRADRAFAPGDGQLRLRYQAKLRDDLRGLYRVQQGGRWYVFSQFQPTSARTALPCFDEPRFKTPFALSVVVDGAQVAAANAPTQVTRRLAGGRKRLSFAATPPLPTYLVALAVGPFAVERAPAIAPAVGRGPIPLRGLAVRGRGAALRPALAHTGRMLRWLERYFGRPYPYAKLDLVAVPDFAAGAMENAGLITFREAYLLLDADSSEAERRMHAYVLGHELAHQWFGNLVTLPWWDELWLNEAFATWMGSKVVGALYPGYRAERTRLAGSHWAMQRDSLPGARAVRQPVQSAHDIHNAFDAITYDKGGAVLSMFERWLGPARFRQGVARYIERHAGGHAGTDDLLRALGEVSGQADLPAMVRPFLDQPGVPQVAVQLQCPAGHPPQLQVRQSVYRPLGTPPPVARRWQLPLCLRGPHNVGQAPDCVRLRRAQARIRWPKGRCPAWLWPNASGTSYLRVQLDAPLRQALQQHGWAQLDAAEQLAAADSLAAAFAAGQLPAAELWSWLSLWLESEARQVRQVALRLLRFAVQHLAEAPGARAAVQRYARQQLRPLLPRLRPPKDARGPAVAEDGERALAWRDLQRFLALVAEHGPTRHRLALHGRQLVGKVTADSAALPALPAPLRGVALAVAVQDGGPQVFDWVRRHLTQSQDGAERSRLLYALGHARSAALAAQARALSLAPDLRHSERLTPLWAQFAMPETRAAAWQWLQEHFASVVAALPPAAAGHLPQLTRTLCRDADAAAVTAFFRPRVTALLGGPRELQAAVASIRRCAAQRRAYSEATVRWFVQQGRAAVAPSPQAP